MSNQVYNLLSPLRGATILSFTARTDARLRKTGNPFGKVYKLSRINALVNFHYDQGVLRRLEKEGKSPDDFKRGESWHEPVLDGDRLTPFCRHKTTGELYLRVMFLRRLGEATYITENGSVLVEKDIAQWKTDKKEAYVNQGLNDPLRFVTYKLDGIEEITLDGETFDLS